MFFAPTCVWKRDKRLSSGSAITTASPKPSSLNLVRWRAVIAFWSVPPLFFFPQNTVDRLQSGGLLFTITFSIQLLHLNLPFPWQLQSRSAFIIPRLAQRHLLYALSRLEELFWIEWDPPRRRSAAILEDRNGPHECHFPKNYCANCLCLFAQLHSVGLNFKYRSILPRKLQLNQYTIQVVLLLTSKSKWS